MQLYIGNKNYSSWSMRPWVALRQFGIPFEEVMLRFDDMEPGSLFKTRLAQISPAGTVPVLVDDGFAVWDTLAIAEYLAEKFPAKRLWPADTRERARARSLCAEMHGGFQALRNHCVMNIEAELAEIGARVLRDEPGVASDLARIVGMWQHALGQSGGPFLFGEFGIVDAYFAPVGARITTYALPVPADIKAYVARVFALPATQAWSGAARNEHDFIVEDEPYRTRPVG